MSDGEGGWIYVDPFEVILTDFSGLSSRGEVTNCLMSNNAGVYCDSESGSGKRIKTWLTGRNPFDITLRTTPSLAYPSVDYFTFGKTSNYTGARITGFTVELIDENGDPMSLSDPANAVLFNLAATDIGLGAKLPEGLFGEGGHEGNIGFFSDTRAGFARVTSSDVLEFGALSNAEYVTHFGTSFLDNSMTPDGLFWDDNADPDDESALVAWNNLAGGGWTYGTLETPENIDARLAELAATLGVEVVDLNYVAGGLVPDDILAAAEANGLFETGEIEDLRNANLNYTITVGDLDGGEFTIRIAPQFAEIVELSETDTQFKLSGMLDAAANVPYMDLGNSGVYQAAIQSLLGMEADDRAAELESVGFSFLPAFNSLGYEFSRNQIRVITDTVSRLGDAPTVSSQGDASAWQMGEDVYWLLGLEGARATYETTASSIGYDLDFTALSVGAEKHVNSSLSYGFLFGASQGDVDAEDGRGTIDSDGLSLAAFVRSHFGQNGFVQAVLGYQDLSYDTERNVMGMVAEGQTDGSQVFAAVKGEWLYQSGNLTYGPTASVEYYNLSVDGFSETGAGAWNLTVGDQSGDLWLGSVGIRGEYLLPNTAGNTTLTGSLSYTAANGDDMIVQAGFVGLPGAAFPIAGRSDDWVDVQLGFKSRLGSQSMLFGGYRGAFGGDYESHGLNLALQVTF